VENAYIPISADDLAQFVACLPRLRSLSHSACRSLNLHPQLYSSQLRELDVDLYIAGRDDGDDGGDGASAVQVANLSSATGLHRLTLSFSSLHSRYISLASLAGMLELESLTLHNNHIIPQEQFVYIRRLSSLRTLSLSHWNDAHVKLLVEERAHCPPLQLHAVEEIDELNMQRAQLFIRMPTLQRVEPIRITPDALKTLAHGLPDLHTLIVNVSEATAESGWPAVRDSLAACHQLTDLTLVATPLEELSALLLALPPSLRKLDIRHCAGFLQSDAFFQCVAEGGLRQLEQLHVQLRWNEHDAEKVEAWHVRLHACAPWMKAVIEV
jgi:Leucine-rich repeat (LRR) protein